MSGSVFFDAAVFGEGFGFVLGQHDDRAVLGAGEVRGLHDALVEAAEVRELAEVRGLAERHFIGEGVIVEHEDVFVGADAAPHVRGLDCAAGLRAWVQLDF